MKYTRSGSGANHHRKRSQSPHHPVDDTTRLVKAAQREMSQPTRTHRDLFTGFWITAGRSFISQFKVTKSDRRTGSPEINDCSVDRKGFLPFLLRAYSIPRHR